ncbi:hypothetical protein M5689_002611 [Euphorbia peplus]|nr:hypothetical protein M5689_002611 [Euphorbia peplus]
MEHSTASMLEVREFYIGKDEVIRLLKSSLVSKEALTRTLIQKNEPYKENLVKGGFTFSFKRNVPLQEAENGKVRVKLFISKSKKIVCFAEVGEDFLDLVFSFLTIPLGHVLKQMKGASTDGCIGYLYKSVEDLDVEHFKSSNEKQVLLNPKIPPKFGYDNQLTGVEEESCDIYFNTSTPARKVKDPKIPTDRKEDKSNGGFMVGPAMFTVTDNLSVIPFSAISRVTVLHKLNVPLSDIQERVVHVGKEEAVRLLVASESVLTHTFLVLSSVGYSVFGTWKALVYSLLAYLH